MWQLLKTDSPVHLYMCLCGWADFLNNSDCTIKTCLPGYCYVCRSGILPTDTPFDSVCHYGIQLLYLLRQNWFRMLYIGDALHRGFGGNDPLHTTCHVMHIIAIQGGKWVWLRKVGVVSTWVIITTWCGCVFYLLQQLSLLTTMYCCSDQCLSLEINYLCCVYRIPV